MHAVIRTGGKQYRVAPNDVITVEKLAGEPGGEVAFEDVLLVSGEDGVRAGTPRVEGARVTATVLEQARADKIVVFKKKRRKNYRRTHGHRQQVTVLRIADISLGEGAAAKAPPKDETVEE
jgi:large subunit ribosomal protein L21